jgi:hypothetical protein
MTEAGPRHQRELNLGSAGRWDDFAAHRRRVTELILGHRTGQPASRLVVLGAGNCNDLELGRLLAGFGTVDLVDIDADALTGAVARQRVAPGARLRLHGGVDLTAAAPGRLGPLSQADVVVSTTLLTQLIDVAAAAGATGPALLTVRDEHLRLITGLLAPRGVGMLVTDVVSSDTCPPLRDAGPDSLGPLLADCVKRREFLHRHQPVRHRTAAQDRRRPGARPRRHDAAVAVGPGGAQLPRVHTGLPQAGRMAPDRHPPVTFHAGPAGGPPRPPGGRNDSAY